MENLLFHLTIGILFAIVALRGQQSPGNVGIDRCEDGLIDIEENANTTIVCRGFNQGATVKWSVQRTGQQRTSVATCGPGSACTVHQPEHFAALRTPQVSQVFYLQYNTTLDNEAKIRCESQLERKTSSETCTMNVIRKANLSRCVVDVDISSMTATGHCEFEGAYSARRPFTCTWYLKKPGQEVEEVPGSITISNGSNSQCSFSRENLNTSLIGNYTYNILFYPGPDKISNVDVRINNGDATNNDSNESTSQSNAVADTSFLDVFLGVVICVTIHI